MSHSHPQDVGDREDLLRAILQTVADAILIVDADGLVRYANPAAEQIFGRPVEEIVGHPFGLPVVSDETTEVDIVQPDGQNLVAELRTAALALDGTPGYVASIRDITARRRASEHAQELIREQMARARAEENEARARLLADFANALGSSLDYTESLTELARACVHSWADWCVVDLVEGDDELKRIAVAPHDARHAALAGEFRELDPEVTPLPQAPRVMRTGEATFVQDFESHIADPQYLSIMERVDPRCAMIVPLVSRRRTLGVIAFITSDPRRSYSPSDLDIAEEIGRYAGTAIDNSRLYQEADRGNQAKSNFLAIMSHELRTPLNAVIGYADLLSIGIPREIPAEALRHVDRIRASARHLLNFIDEILTFSRSGAERTRLDLEERSVHDVGRQVAALVEPLARERGLRFVVSLPDPDYTIRTDPARLQQILLNLLSNAVKFTPRGRVELDIERVDDWTHFRVTDSGIGIPAEYLERIFEPFWQVEQDRTRRAEGAGLGLSLARRLAQNLGGNLVVQSVVEQGSVFTLQVPNRLSAIRLRRSEPDPVGDV